MSLSLILILGAGCSPSREPSKATVSDSSNVIAVDTVPDFVPTDEQSQGLWNSTKQVYTLRQFQPVASGADSALRALENSSWEGLDPEEFSATELRRMHESLKASADSEAQSDFDRRLTYALGRYV